MHGRRVMLFPCGPRPRPRVFLDGDGPTGGSRKQSKHGIEMGLCRGLLICARGEVAGIVAHGYWFALQIAQIGIVTSEDQKLYSGYVVSAGSRCKRQQRVAGVAASGAVSVPPTLSRQGA